MCAEIAKAQSEGVFPVYSYPFTRVRVWGRDSDCWIPDIQAGFRAKTLPAHLDLNDQACYTWRRRDPENIIVGIPISALQREGVHEEVGPMTLRRCIELPLESGPEQLRAVQTLV